MTEHKYQWLVRNMDRYIKINNKRDSGQSVASCDKEFVALFERRKQECLTAMNMNDYFENMCQ